ncbi:unnamed protein product, partial [Allacma fusca]
QYILISFHLTDPKKNTKRRLKKRLERKQLERYEEFQRLKSYLQQNISMEDSASICKLGLAELAGQIGKGEISAVKSLHAFMLKALLQSEKLNCVTDFNPGALGIAEDLDNKFQDTDAVLVIMMECIHF